MAKTKATGLTSALFGSVPKRGRDEIARIIADQSGGLTLIELLARNWDYEALFRCNRSDNEVARMVQDLETELVVRHGCSPEQARRALPFLSLTQDLWEAAIARRFALDDPAELGRGLAVLSRLRWLEGALGEGSGANGDVVLEALAVRDTEAATQLAAGKPAVSIAADGEELGFRDLMTLAVLAAARGDESGLGDAVRRMAGQPLRPWQLGVRRCLTGLAARSPADVVEGLAEYLDGLRRLKQKTALEEAVALTAHGLYRLCERASPALVSGFDVAGPLPWDAGFHAWTVGHPDPLAGLDLGSVSPSLQNAILGLRSPIAS